MGGMRQRLQIPVYFDFASSLCYVAHRVAGRLEPDLEKLDLELRWIPLDLANLLGIQRGAELLPARRENAARVARELEVPVAIPRVWIDTRALLAVAVHLDRAGERASAETWRERVFSELFEGGRDLESAEQALALASEAGHSISVAELERAESRLHSMTFEAGQHLVTGVPTFMLGEWAFGGIQSDDTMLAILERFAERRRDGRM